jgi:hypothetical protein
MLKTHSISGGFFASRFGHLLAVASACALFSVLPVSAQTGGAAKVVSMSGQVSVLHGSLPWALNTGDLIEPMQTIQTGTDGTAVFRVADGSTFDVYPNSQVVFRANQGNWKDLVDVFLGKIKVKIEHFGSVPNHNTVRTPTAVIAVRGTIFDVSVDGSGDSTEVICEEGRVEVTHLTMPGRSRMLDPGDSVTVFKNQPLAKSTVDRGAVLQKAVRIASDAVNEILLRRSTGGTGSAGTAGTTSTASGDKGGTPAPTGGTPPPVVAPPPPHN